MITGIMSGSLAGASMIIQDAFASVFADVNFATDAWYEGFKLKTSTRKRYAEHIVRTVGTFPLFGTTKVATVDQAYVQIQLSDELERYRYRSPDAIADALVLQQTGDVSEFRHGRSQNVLDVLEEGKRSLAIVGAAGSGKTTALRHIAVKIAAGQTIRGRRMLPLFLAVRDFAKQHTIHGAAIRFLKWLGVGRSEAVFESLLRTGSVLLLVDGVDEVDKQYQERTVDELRSLAMDYPRTVVCVTARPYTLNVALPGFDTWETIPLDFDSRVAFVNRWFTSVDSQKGGRLIEECAREKSLLDLGSNPLLLSMVCALYYNDLKIPSDPDELYARVVEGLLGAWDSFRTIARESPLASLAVRRRVVLVTWLAFALLEGRRRVFSARDVESSDVLERFAASTRAPRIAAEELLRSLYNDFGILLERAPGQYSFSHLTFHEYLAAQYIVDNRQELSSLQRRDDQAWEEVLRLTAKMLPNATDYMRLLTDGTNLADARQLNLLRSAWELHPICEIGTLAEIAQSLADRAVRAVAGLLTSYQVVNDVLYVSVGVDAVAAEARANLGVASHAEQEIAQRVRTLRNLHLLMKVFAAMRVSIDELALRTTPPFEKLSSHGLLSSVVVRDA